MTLYKLIGYNESQGIYINPNTGLEENMPSSPFYIGDSVIDNYALFDDPQNWADYGISLVGSVFGLKDYLSIRKEIYTRIEVISGTDYSNWNLLSTYQKSIACIWSNVRVINARGLAFYTAACGSATIVKTYITNFLDQSTSARKCRYYIPYSIFGYTYLGKPQCLVAENYAKRDFLDTFYIERGVMYDSEDGVDGLGDWINGLGPYTITGLKPRIIAGEFTLINGMDVTTFCNTTSAILHDGLY